MTKGIPPRHAIFKKRDANQEDAHAPEHITRPLKIRIPREQQQHEAAAKNICRPTPIEELLDLELDFMLPTTATSVSMNNQYRASSTRKREHIDSVSLEFLALQSPHGENQQWQNEEYDQNVDSTSHAISTGPEHSPQRKKKETSAPRKPMPLSIVSPTAFVPCFPPSPTHPSTDDYGLASPMALPDSPSHTRSELTLVWNLEPSSPTPEDAPTRTETFQRLTQSRSVQRPKRRASSFTPVAKAATPNPKGYVPNRATSRIRSSLPTLPEVREVQGKARHGGIYSLLLKNKAMKQEPVLVEDVHTPEELVATPSVSKVSPPRTFSKQKHGGIYKMLRASNEPR